MAAAGGQRVKTSVIRWERPPPPSHSGGYPLGRGKSRWEPVADELRAQPREWALIAEGPIKGANRALATQIRMGHLVCFSPAGDFDAESRREDGILRVWAVFVGDLEDKP